MEPSDLAIYGGVVEAEAEAELACPPMRPMVRASVPAVARILLANF
jgi:hypothetical protein